MIRFVPHSRAIPSLLLALCAAFHAFPASAQDLSADLRKKIDDARRDAEEVQAKLATLPARCTLGDAGGVSGHWIDSRDAAGEPGSPYTFNFTFKEPIRTGAFHVALNPNALRNLVKVESRDAAGRWREAWAGVQADAPAGCEFVKLARTFASGVREVAALRITIRPDPDIIRVADAGVLKAD